jgi:hypothetical protein
MLTTTQIGDHFGLKMTSEFIVETLKIPNDGKEKRAFLWSEDKIPVIGAAIIEHVKRNLQAPAAAADEDDLFA